MKRMERETINKGVLITNAGKLLTVVKVSSTLRTIPSLADPSR